MAFNGEKLAAPLRSQVSGTACLFAAGICVPPGCRDLSGMPCSWLVPAIPGWEVTFTGALGRVQRGEGRGCVRLSLPAHRLGSFVPTEAHPGRRSLCTFPRMLQKPLLSVTRQEISVARATIHLKTTSVRLISL